MTVRCGADQLLGQADRLRGRRYALLAHAASVVTSSAGRLRPLHLVLAGDTAAPPQALFGPEHGYWGVEQDMVPSRDARDPWTGVPILSLYGDDEASLRPRPEAFAGLDLLLIDLQDFGSRYYTYGATAVWAAEAALAAGVEVWVLDRPNPLGGMRCEGNLVAPGFESFVGALRTPVRHGLTLGELVRLEAKRRRWDDTGLEIVPITGWRRGMGWSETGLAWIAPSPNMPTPSTALIYPGGCLIEATTISEGRGTSRPFQLVGAPGVDPRALVAALEASGVKGVECLPTYFKPQFQKHAGKVCGGVEIVVRDPGAFAPYRFGIALLHALQTAAPACFAWRHEPYEFVAETPAIDLLTGSDTCRRAFEAGRDVSDWLATWPAAETAFQHECAEILLYPPDEGRACA
jgi:uncharacterized protein YbbC (DUF1343 family)